MSTTNRYSEISLLIYTQVNKQNILSILGANTAYLIPFIQVKLFTGLFQNILVFDIKCTFIF